MLAKSEVNMSIPGSVTNWLHQVKKVGLQSAGATKLWERYAPLLNGLAIRHLGHTPKQRADEEDVASVAFWRFLEAVTKEKYEKLDDRNDVEQVLRDLARKVASNQRRHEKAKIRGEGKVRGLCSYRRHPLKAPQRRTCRTS